MIPIVNLIVIKRNNKEEKFNSKKIINACKSAGASEETARRVADEITEEIIKLHSSKIRDLALQKLESISPEVAKSWKEYDTNVKKR